MEEKGFHELDDPSYCFCTFQSISCSFQSSCFAKPIPLLGRITSKCGTRATLGSNWAAAMRILVSLRDLLGGFVLESSDFALEPFKKGILVALV